MVKVWRKRNPHALLVGMQTGIATVENRMKFPQKFKNVSPIGPIIPLLFTKKMKIIIGKKLSLSPCLQSTDCLRQPCRVRGALTWSHEKYRIWNPNLKSMPKYNIDIIRGAYLLLKMVFKEILLKDETKKAHGWQAFQ